jgi:hypothetical protein
MSPLRCTLALSAHCLMILLGAAPVWAEDAEPGPTSAESASSGSETQRAAHDPMDWLGLSLKLGYSHQNPGAIDNPVYNTTLAQAAAMLTRAELESTGLVGSGGCSLIDRRCHTAARSGFQLAATLHLGGDGFGWDVEPYMMWSDAATALGVYSGPKFDIHLADPLYFGFGFGFKLAYVWADGWQHAADIGGRIPVHVTMYLAKDLALTIEGAFGAGVSGYLKEKQQVTIEGETLGTVPKMSFGAARVWDLSVGVRFP